MSTLDPAVKNVIFIVLMVAMSFVFFIIILVMTYKKRSRTLVIETKLKEAELEKVKLENQIETLRAINEEKERISADIHDDMGSNVSSINLLSKLIQINNLEAETFDQIKEIQLQSLELSQKMKDIIWATKSENDKLENLLFYIQHYVIKQLEPLGFKVKIHKPELIDDIVLKGELRKDIFMTVKECINNIVKHSEAKMVEVNMSCDNRMICIKIQDDGKGLTDTVHSGNGLKQMKKRMERHQGSVHFENKQGLCVTLKVTL